MLRECTVAVYVFPWVLQLLMIRTSQPIFDYVGISLWFLLTECAIPLNIYYVTLKLQENWIIRMECIRHQSYLKH